MSGTIKDSRAIVTGGVQGIGFQLCRHLLIKGAKMVAIFDIDQSAGQEATNKLNQEFGQGRSIFFATDVANSNELENSFKKAVQKLGGLEIVINNAGILDSAVWSLMIDINVKGVVQGTLLGIDYMGKHKGGKGGTIINTGSIAPFMKESFSPIYASTKAAVVTFSRFMGNYYEKTGVAVKSICPGLVITNLAMNMPSKCLEYVDKEQAQALIDAPGLEPKDIAPAVMQLIEDPSNNAAWVKMTEYPTSTVKFAEIPDSLIPLDL
ncbi:15-hydroxyprostaglandin dehydrogenase [NAD(+)]-like [Chelonus insularis]|uniref:15-hydroxyprostaglandin dehydrogenase [NAD(+)]-like n=1 Tax=Chelonus insularis TaxID=460826 RepID=UPI001588E52F|nr:15-hydroxyprostaglandin dehydrogenase [NAD(+)]-like [Chelonus insularis]XP_034945545.1 15-hydroxyprostaglandin dehydrogenase [NAD(+)]-like [Chelonus insularis]